MKKSKKDTTWKGVPAIRAMLAIPIIIAMMVFPVFPLGRIKCSAGRMRKASRNCRS